MNIVIRPLTESDIPAFFEHQKIHGAESGMEGEIIFTPTEGSWVTTLEEFAPPMKDAIRKNPGEIGWGRCWIAVDGEKIVGELTLKCGVPLKAALHRSLLSMGIQKAYRGKKIGGHLMKSAIEWARADSKIEWIDLYVFGHNTAALHLYRKYGFIERGRIPDSFRVYGQKIEDVSMVLSLHREGG